MVSPYTWLSCLLKTPLGCVSSPVFDNLQSFENRSYILYSVTQYGFVRCFPYGQTEVTGRFEPLWKRWCLGGAGMALTGPLACD